MDTFELTAAAILTAPGAATAAVLVAGVTQAVKGFLPAAWQYGRAPMVLAAALAALLVVLAVMDAALGIPQGILPGLMAWVAVYTGAVGTHQTVTKASRVAGGTTNPAGPDQEGGQ